MFDAYSLPTEIEAGKQKLHVRNDGDWRMCIDVSIALSDPELTDDEKMIAALTIFYDTPIEQIVDLEGALTGMMDFMAAGSDRGDHGAKKPKLIDWQDDAAIIVSGVNTVVGREVRADKYMHWWTFVAAYMAIGDSTLATVVGIRDKIARGKKLEKHEQEFRRNNPGYFAHKRENAAQHALLLDLIDD